MDTVYSKQTKKTTLLVLTERKGRGECIIKMKSRTENEVKRALDRLERILTPKGFREIFKTITCDNGGEFADPNLIEKACINKKIPRTVLYYCHPYSSWERGSNENNNRFIRRWIKKGEDFGDYSDEEIQEIQDWVNDYPRRIFDGMSANQFSQSFHNPIHK